MYHVSLSFFDRWKKRFSVDWMRVRIHIRRKVLTKTDPLEFLHFCAKMVVSHDYFRLTPGVRTHLIYAPQPAAEFTEILNKVSQALKDDTNAKVIFTLGPFEEMTAEQFLLDKEVELLDSGVAHVLFHMLMIMYIVDYLKQERSFDKLETKPEYFNSNTRILTPMMSEFQKYVDSILKLYD